MNHKPRWVKSIGIYRHREKERNTSHTRDPEEDWSKVCHAVIFFISRGMERGSQASYELGLILAEPTLLPAVVRRSSQSNNGLNSIWLELDLRQKSRRQASSLS